MKHYELLAVLPGTLTETEAQDIAGQIKDAIEKNGGSTPSMEFNGKSRLSYPMRHIRYGYFFVFTFEAAEAAIQIIQEKIRLVPQVLRFLCKIYNPAQKVSLNLGETPAVVTENDLNPEKKDDAQPHVVPEMTLENAPVAAPVVEETVVEPKTENKKAAKNDISMEEIDQKLDELLGKNDA